MADSRAMTTALSAPAASPPALRAANSGLVTFQGFPIVTCIKRVGGAAGSEHRAPMQLAVVAVYEAIHHRQQPRQRRVNSPRLSGSSHPSRAHPSQRLSPPTTRPPAIQIARVVARSAPRPLRARVPGLCEPVPSRLSRFIRTRTVATPGLFGGSPHARTMSSLSSLSPEPAPVPARASAKQAPRAKTNGASTPKAHSGGKAAPSSAQSTPSKGRKRKADEAVRGEVETEAGAGAVGPAKEEEAEELEAPVRTPRNAAPGRKTANGSAKKAKVEQGDAEPTKGTPKKAAATKRGAGAAKKGTAGSQIQDAVGPDATVADLTVADADAQPAKKPRAKKTAADPFSAELRAAHPPRSGPDASLSSSFRTPSGRPTHLVGAHTSTAGGPGHALMGAGALGANALALFLKNQRRWVSEKWGDEVGEGFRGMMLETDMGGVLGGPGPGGAHEG